MELNELTDPALNILIDFFFNHTPAVDIHCRWYKLNSSNPPYTQSELIDLYASLFVVPRLHLEKYGSDQLEEGFWGILWCGLLHEGLRNQQIAITNRIICIKSMFTLYRDLFAAINLPTITDMWWDCLVTDYRLHGKDQDDKFLIRDTLFNTMNEILQLDSDDCQSAALHGLGHLQHPKTESILLKYLEDHSELDEEDRQYVFDCIAGDVM